MKDAPEKSLEASRVVRKMPLENYTCPQCHVIRKTPLEIAFGNHAQTEVWESVTLSKVLLFYI